jgi:3-methyladenine DNA glycosylase Mpg
LGITVKRDNGVDLTGEEMFLLRDPAEKPRVRKTARIGVDYALHWKHELLRFIDMESRAVSGKRHLRGTGL